MMTLQSLVLAFCVWSGMSCPATATVQHTGEECFASKHQAWESYPGHHLYHHRTPNGVCWHIGERNHSGSFLDTKPSQPKGGKHIWKVRKPRKDWSRATPSKYNGDLILLEGWKRLE